MFKKDDLEEFLYLWSKADIIPFTNYEDALVNNFSALDIPFIEYSQSVIGWSNYIKVEISENLLSLTRDDREMYLDYVKNRVENETWPQNNDKLIGLLKTLNISTDSLSFEENMKLYDVLNFSFKELSSQEDLVKFKQLHHEYYLLLLNTERNSVIEYLKELSDNELRPASKSYKDEAWFNFGVELAYGNLRKYYTVNSKGVFVINKEFSARKIAKELNIEKDNNLISGTFNNYSKEHSNSNRNIFNDSSKISRIMEHCKKKNINVASEFLNRIPTE